MVDPAEGLQVARAHDGAGVEVPPRADLRAELRSLPEEIACLVDRLAGGTLTIGALLGDGAESYLQPVQRVLILGTAGSYHAGRVARYWIERLAGLPCAVELASEFRFGGFTGDGHTLVVAVSRAGDNPDTVRAVKEARNRGMVRAVAVSGVADSELARVTPLRLETHTGELRLTALTPLLVGLYAFALALGCLRGKIDERQVRRTKPQLRSLPGALSAVAALDRNLPAWFSSPAPEVGALFTGHGQGLALAGEGAHLFRDIAGMYADAFPPGELDREARAHLTGTSPVIVVAPADETLEALRADVEAALGRAGRPFVITDALPPQFTTWPEVLRLPRVEAGLSPVVLGAALQLLACHWGARGEDASHG